LWKEVLESGDFLTAKCAAACLFHEHCHLVQQQLSAQLSLLNGRQLHDCLLTATAVHLGS